VVSSSQPINKNILYITDEEKIEIINDIKNGIKKDIEKCNKMQNNFK
jgi:hypothetical protein